MRRRWPTFDGLYDIAARIDAVQRSEHKHCERVPLFGTQLQRFACVRRKFPRKASE